MSRRVVGWMGIVLAAVVIALGLVMVSERAQDREQNRTIQEQATLIQIQGDCLEAVVGQFTEGSRNVRTATSSWQDSVTDAHKTLARLIAALLDPATSDAAKIRISEQVQAASEAVEQEGKDLTATKRENKIPDIDERCR